ncbi:MAG: hypothetical protein Q8L20_04250 [Gammaproteobacteria bacterium]|nr:hypothetical protein [Gammaproteobacteria bacterium]
MKINYFPGFKSILGRSATRQGRVTSRFRINAVKVERTRSSTLEVDLHTQKDLEIFESDDASKSLFALCNSTRTEGGAQILRQRMSNPFSDVTSITRTQQSISYIPQNRDLFERLGLWVTGRVERYQRDPLIFVVETSTVGFAMGALTLRMFDSYHYIRVLRGVQYTCLFVQRMREYLHELDRDPPKGELACISEDIRNIVSLPEFLDVPQKELRGVSFLKILRLDQTFRVYSKEKIEELLRLAYELDALVSMADATHNLGYTIPEVLDGPTRFHATGLVHPQVKNPVPNAAGLDQQRRLLFLTGPNMAGKTTYLRSVATALYLGHLGMGVPAASFAFTPVDRLFTSIAISDDVHTGTSYFLAEVLRIKSLAFSLSEGQRVVAIMDEPFKGTNVSEALEASLAVMQRLESIGNSLFLFSSHLIELEDGFGNSGNIMKCHFEADETEGKLQFNYLLQPGVSRQRMGMRVLTEEGVFDLLDKVVSLSDGFDELETALTTGLKL